MMKYVIAHIAQKKRGPSARKGMEKAHRWAWTPANTLKKSMVHLVKKHNEQLIGAFNGKESKGDIILLFSERREPHELTKKLEHVIKLIKEQYKEINIEYKLLSDKTQWSTKRQRPKRT